MMRAMEFTGGGTQCHQRDKPGSAAETKQRKVAGPPGTDAEPATMAKGVAASPRVLAQRKQLQGAFGPAIEGAGGPERNAPPAPVQRRKNEAGLPHTLKTGIEALSGMSMDDVRVHYNSAQPAQLNALAYTQGSDIHMAPGQEKHLPHEAWHVVQQAQGRVHATRQMRSGVDINDDSALEREADVMGARALQLKTEPSDRVVAPSPSPLSRNQPVQRLMGVEAEVSVPVSTVGPAANGTQRVTSFLSGGVQEGTQIEPMNAHGYMKEADHDDVSRESFNVLSQANATYATGIAVPGFRVANLEYKTRPFDEENAVERAAFQNCIRHMVNDMIAVTFAGRTALTPNAAGTHNVGLPPVLDWNHFSGTHAATGMPLGWGVSARNAINNLISSQPDVQITMGIRLEKIRAHLIGANTHAVLHPAAAHNPNGFLTVDPVVSANNVIGNTMALTPAMRGSGALKGYFALVIQYLHGNFAYRGANATVHKNMVGFLSKYPLHHVQRELDGAIRPDQWTSAQRTAVRHAIIMIVNNRKNQADVAPLWQGIMGGENGGPLGNWRQWLRRAMRGQSDAFSAVQITPARYLAPTDHINSTVIAPGPNARPSGGGGLHHSGVIPLEARHIGRVLTGTLWNTVNSVITHVRNTNA